MVMRFVIGQTLEAAKEAEILAESRQYGGFLRLSLQVKLFNMWHACVIQQLGMFNPACTKVVCNENKYRATCIWRLAETTQSF